MATKPKEEFELVEFMQKDAPDVRFHGKLLGEIDSRKVDDRQRARDSDRFTKLELYELESGNWVAAKVACSNRAGEVDFASVTVLDRIVGREGDRVTFARSDLTQRAVLQAFGWTWLAKAFADKMGWDHVEELR